MAENFTILAKFSIRSGQIEKAKIYLKESLSIHETQEAALLDAELLRRENAPTDVIMNAENRAISAIAGAAWHCNTCAHKTINWEPTCPNCHGFDSLEWGTGKKSSAIALEWEVKRIGKKKEV